MIWAYQWTVKRAGVALGGMPATNTKQNVTSVTQNQAPVHTGTQAATNTE